MQLVMLSLFCKTVVKDLKRDGDKIEDFIQTHFPEYFTERSSKAYEHFVAEWTKTFEKKGISLT